MADEMVAAAMTAIRLAAAENRGVDDQFAEKIVELAEQRGLKALQYLVAALARAGAGGFTALANHTDQPIEKVLHSYELHVQSGPAADLG